MSTQNEQALLDSIPTGLFIGGEWIEGETGATFDVKDPSTNQVIRTIADATPADGIRALDAAVAAQDEWAATAPRVRGEILRRAFDLVQERKEDLALLMTLEMANPWPRPAARSPTAASSSAGSARRPCASAAATA